jgi:HK97 family phage portal protein
MWFSRKKEIEKLKEELAAIKDQITPTDSQAFRDMFINGFIPVPMANQDTAMKVSAVFACVRLIAGAIASSKVQIYKRGSGGRREPMENHPYRTMLSLTPNENITAATFWKVMAANKVLNGNAYAAIVRGKQSGRPVGLIPLKPARVTPYQAWELALEEKLGTDPHRVFYSVGWDNGDRTLLDQDDMIHVPNLGWDGKQGLSTITAGAQAMNLALNAEQSASKMFEQGMMSQLALVYPNKMTPDAQQQLREHLHARHSGSHNHHKPLILTEGGDIKAMSMNADDAQLIESRQFSVIDICRFFGVPPVMVGETSKTTSFGSGVEQMARWFVMFTLNDHLTDIEQELEKKLFRNSDFFCEFDETELTRGDTKTRADFNKAAIGSSQQPGWMTPNEIRASEYLPPISGGDDLFMPQQNTTPSEGDDEEPTNATVQRQPDDTGTEEGGD